MTPVLHNKKFAIPVLVLLVFTIDRALVALCAVIRAAPVSELVLEKLAVVDRGLANDFSPS
jgi:hypothetical protein